MPVLPIIALSAGLILASRFASRWLAKQAERPGEIVGDWPWLHPEMVAASKPYLAGGGRTEQTRRRETQHNRTVLPLDRTHSGECA